MNTRIISSTASILIALDAFHPSAGQRQRAVEIQQKAPAKVAE